MMTWSNILFPNSNSPMMEHLIYFHDHTMIITLMIVTITMYVIMNIMMNNYLNRFMMEGNTMEILWTLMPAIILLYIALPSLQVLYLMEESFTPSMTIKVIGHQWYWTYEYPDYNIEFDSFMSKDNSTNMFRLLDTDNRLIMPYYTNMQFMISSDDVIHSWTIMALGIKMDAIPGRLNQINMMANRPGIFFGQCSEICGANHSFMPISLEITSLNNFMSWIKQY
uniref:Cytochrome c oxidase subunit 2 n=1 Tax=Chiropterargas boueti TaxID=1827022 RepID=A0A1P8AG38_9ACAR|nr:cytochrome c oxidase subunit II [Chiropterargas boueti]AMX74068.1 cytochrome c oxidase subunit II [Chiropterargas boueti]AMX74081.1 cytochrome c oxidase subunit II [Chiropterargas boueti]